MIRSLNTTSFGVWNALSPMATLRITIILRPLPIFRNGRTLSRKMWENLGGGGVITNGEYMAPCGTWRE